MFMLSVGNIRLVGRRLKDIKAVTMAFSSLKDRILTMALDEKRKLYRCAEKFVELTSIPTWQSSGVKDDSIVSKYPVNVELNDKVSVFCGDITTLEIDAIVNAANNRLLGGGGVDGAIHRAAGRELKEECATLNGCHTGDAKITGGYSLPARYVIHAVGPVGEKPEKLESCYDKCLKLMKENGLRSIAFPCISTGIYGYPNEPAAHIALRTTREFLQADQNASNVDRVIFCLFLQKDIEIYDALLPKYFPKH